jgi:hypothetical protein
MGNFRSAGNRLFPAITSRWPFASKPAAHPEQLPESRRWRVNAEIVGLKVGSAAIPDGQVSRSELQNFHKAEHVTRIYEQSHNALYRVL